MKTALGSPHVQDIHFSMHAIVIFIDRSGQVETRTVCQPFKSQCLAMAMVEPRSFSRVPLVRSKVAGVSLKGLLEVFCPGVHVSSAMLKKANESGFIFKGKLEGQNNCCRLVAPSNISSVLLTALGPLRFLEELQTTETLNSLVGLLVRAGGNVRESNLSVSNAIQEADLSVKTGVSRGCPLSRYPNVVRNMVHDTILGPIDMHQPARGTAMIAIKCETCGHVVTGRANSLLHRVDHDNEALRLSCRYCAYDLCDDDGCSVCFGRSLGSSFYAPFLNEEKTGRPSRLIRISSNTKVWFTCPECMHDFSALPSNVSKNQWCPFCSGRLVCAAGECIRCTSRTVAGRLGLLELWDTATNGSPLSHSFASQTFKSWKCTHCSHTWVSKIANVWRSVQTGSTGCPYCSGRRLCGSEQINSCEVCCQRSFGANPCKKFWHPTLNAGEDPLTYTLGSEREIYWKCPDCQAEGRSAAVNVAKYLDRGGCPCCAPGGVRGEQRLHEALNNCNSLARCAISRQVGLSLTGGARVKRMDFEVKHPDGRRFGWEIDGGQHFRSETPRFKTTWGYQFMNDLVKTMTYLSTKEASLVRTRSRYSDKLDAAWVSKLCSDALGPPSLLLENHICYRPLALTLQYLAVIGDNQQVSETYDTIIVYSLLHCTDIAAMRPVKIRKKC